MCILSNLRKNMEDVSHQRWQNETDRFHLTYVILSMVQPLIITILIIEFNFCWSAKLPFACYVRFIAHFRSWNRSKWARVKSTEQFRHLLDGGLHCDSDKSHFKDILTVTASVLLARVSAEGQTWQPVGKGSTNSCSRWGYYETSSSKMNVSKANKQYFHRSTS